MAHQTPYIGCTISLISRAEIRYEGTLYNVDTKDSTIALAKVRSMGTEDRCPQKPVAARDDIYEYIIFKASDIKDLVVCDKPKQAQITPGLHYDPAIVSVSGRQQPVPILEMPPSRINIGAFQQQRHHILEQMCGSGDFARSRPSFQPRNFQPMHMNEVRTGEPPQPREKITFTEDYDFAKANEQFQEALESMEKMKINKNDVPVKDEAVKVEKTDETKEPFYDKHACFFDRISCEAVEKQEGRVRRVNWRKERELNQETFGQSAAHQPFGFQRWGRPPMNFFRSRNVFYNSSGFQRRTWNAGHTPAAVSARRMSDSEHKKP